jgi:hypothetical protein
MQMFMENHRERFELTSGVFRIASHESGTKIKSGNFADFKNWRNPNRRNGIGDFSPESALVVMNFLIFVVAEEYPYGI